MKTAAETFVPNPKLDVAKVLSQLGTGEALVSTLQDKGVPMPVQQTLIAPPRCRMGPITEAERAQVRAGSRRQPLRHRDQPRIGRRTAGPARAEEHRAGTGAGRAAASRTKLGRGFRPGHQDAIFGTKRRQGMIETMAKQTTRTVGTKLGNQIVRGILGGIFGGKR